MSDSVLYAGYPPGALRRALETNAWDGDWYRRGYYDDGEALGSATRDECRIDSVAQSWAVLSGAADTDRARRAMQAVQQTLVRSSDGMILLMAPPFDRSRQEPGYIKSYPPGIRENGGQYTHAAVWVVWALAELGEADLAVRLFTELLPTQRAGSADGAQRYRVEPYVLAADVYAVGAHRGRGGWTWYTGSAGWAYRLGCEVILGLHRDGQSWSVDPCIPPTWPGFEVDLRDGATLYKIKVHNPHGVSRGVESVLVDGVERSDLRVPRETGSTSRRVEIILGRQCTATANISARVAS